MKRTLAMLSLCLVVTTLWAQPKQQGQPPFNPQKFQQMVETELTKAANLTEDEAKTFFPVYNEMKKKQMEIGRQIMQLKKGNAGDAKSSAEAINKISDLKVQQAEVERSYNKKMMKLVGSEKLLNIIKAEDDFHRRMVQKQRDGRRNGKHRTHRSQQ